MTPEELALIAADAEQMLADAERVAVAFYGTLFDIAPELRRLFPDEMASQRVKLVDQLTALVGLATSWRDSASLDAFVSVAHALGRRHVTYGVTPPMYEPVRIALLAALRDGVDGFDAAHTAAWEKFDRLISETMLEGGSVDGR